VGTRCADHVTPLYPRKMALTSPTGGGRSVGIVRVRTKATEFSFSGVLLDPGAWITGRGRANLCLELNHNDVCFFFKAGFLNVERHNLCCIATTPALHDSVSQKHPVYTSYIWTKTLFCVNIATVRKVQLVSDKFKIQTECLNLHKSLDRHKVLASRDDVLCPH